MKITKQMLKDFDLSIKAWSITKHEGRKDKSLTNAYKSDRKDMRKILSYLKKGEFEKAAEKTYYLDTIVREQIPNNLYKVISGNYDDKTF